MPENEFEKQVKDLMDELKITPSAPVWETLEKRIPKSNRRRRFFAFFLLLTGFAVCGYFVYYKFYSGNYAATVVRFEDSNAAITKTKRIPPANPDASGAAAIAREEKRSNEQPAATEKPAERILPNAIPTAKNTGNPTRRPAINHPTPDDVLRTNNEKNTDKNATGKFFAGTEEPTISKQSETADPETYQTTELPDDHVSVTQSAGTSLVIEKNDESSKNLIMPDTSKKVTAEATKRDIKNAANKQKKISVGLTAFYGKSDVIEKFNLGLSGADKAYAEQLTGMPANGYLRDSLVYENKAKDVKASLSFAIGVVATKPVGPRSSVSAGIEYLQMKTQIQTGIMKDSGGNFNYNNSQISTRLDNFYTAGGNITQTNTYRFIRVPVFYSYRFTNNKRLYFNTDAGFSLLRLVSADALIYDSYNQAFYKNNDVLNKTQINFLVGLNANVRFHNDHTLTFGPQAQYSPGSVTKNYSTKQHFFAWGLQARYYFNKR